MRRSVRGYAYAVVRLLHDPASRYPNSPPRAGVVAGRCCHLREEVVRVPQSRPRHLCYGMLCHDVI